MPEVSVIVPNFNHAGFLQKRLDSIFNQTFQDFEVILLDDASTDDSIKILKEYSGNPKVSHFKINKENSGSPFKQWEKGISLAKGRYIWIAESDDWAEKEFLEKCFYSIQDKKADIVIANNNKVTESGILANTHHKEISFNQLLDFGSVSDLWLKRNIIENASSVLFKNIGIPSFSTVSLFKLNGDWLFWMLYSRDKKLLFLDEKLNNFRCFQSTVRNNQSKKGNNWFECLRLYYYLLKEKVVQRKTGKKYYLIALLKLLEFNSQSKDQRTEIKKMNEEFNISHYDLIVTRIKSTLVLLYLKWRRKLQW